MFPFPPHPPMPIPSESRQSIKLFRGDDTNFAGNQSIYITLDTELDISGCKATLKCMGFTKTWDVIPEDHRLEIVFSASETCDLPIGNWDATLYLTDSEGRKRTVVNRLLVEVTTCVGIAYGESTEQHITVIVNGSNLVKMVNHQKPDEDGNIEVSAEFKPFKPERDIFDMNCNDWEFRKAFAKLWKVCGGAIINEE